MENLDDDKLKTETSRIPSPSSVSSVHSVRPLEWDSGADIGYRCKVSSNLSTVERMALVRGTANLLETCQSVNTTGKFNAPLAHSSPFVAIANLYGQKSTDFQENESTKRIVDYTISDDESLSSPVKSSVSNCKSLEDLRFAIRKKDQSLTERSHSTNNIPAARKQSGHLSASSVATVLSNRNYSNKAIQVNETSLKTVSSNRTHSSMSSGIDPLTTSSNNPTYIVEASIDPSRNTSDESYNRCASRSRTTNHSLSYADSSDRSSFEYVPGSMYDLGDSGRKSSINADSDVNTLCSEVINGVELVTRYVNNLRVSNKSKVIRKMAQTLMSNLSCSAPSKCQSMTNNDFNLSDINSKDWGKHIKEVASGLNPDGPTCKVLSNDKSSTSAISQTHSTIGDSVSIKGISRTTSNLTTDESSGRLKSCSDKSSETSTNMQPLKEFLSKERETQLLWIKSGIDHLNNLKRLYESQRRLKKNLHSLKKIKTVEEASTPCENNSQKQTLTSQFRRQSSTLSTKSHLNDGVESSISMRISQRRNDENGMSKTSSTPTDRLVSYASHKMQTRNGSSRCKHDRRFYKRLSSGVENKENIPQNRLGFQTFDTFLKSKPSIYYTVLFDKKPQSFVTIQNYVVKEDITRTGVHREYSKRNTSRRKCGAVESSTRPSLTLQDYLLQNKPEYVSKAECRRQCLEEIAKLRQLRDKSRDELLTVLQNEPDRVQCSVPPPLSVLRIFDDKFIKQQTARKYQQLPEVQNKKLEVKRKESYRRNQIMAKVFTKKLQKKVLKGQVSLSSSVNVVSI